MSNADIAITKIVPMDNMNGKTELNIKKLFDIMYNIQEVLTDLNKRLKELE